MRCIQLAEHKKLRGIPRRLRALAKWAESFVDYRGSIDEERYQYQSFKIPVIDSLVNPPHTTRDIQIQSVSHLLRAAELIATSPAVTYTGYYRVACLITLPYLHESEVTLFFCPEYYQRFMGETNALAPRQLSTDFGLRLPAGFVECGSVSLDEETDIRREHWAIGQPL